MRYVVFVLFILGVIAADCAALYFMIMNLRKHIYFMKNSRKMRAEVLEKDFKTVVVMLEWQRFATKHRQYMFRVQAEDGRFYCIDAFGIRAAFIGIGSRVRILVPNTGGACFTFQNSGLTGRILYWGVFSLIGAVGVVYFIGLFIEVLLFYS